MLMSLLQILFFKKCLGKTSPADLHKTSAFVSVIGF